MRIVDFANKTDQLLLVGEAVEGQSYARDGIQQHLVPIVRLGPIVRHDRAVGVEVLHHIPEPKQGQELIARIRKTHVGVRELVVERRIAHPSGQRHEELARPRRTVGVNVLQSLAQAGAEVTPGELIEWARERVAGYKLPKSVDFIEALPRNPTGKILKRELRKAYWGEHGRQVN